jgi:XTP/dITP diphosphohydrolase
MMFFQSSDMSTTTIVVATGNAHKVHELRELLAAHGLHDVHLVPITDIVASFNPDETGSTFQENAYIKALAAFELTGLPSLADDSGLEVDLLGGLPGVRSARFAGVDATDADNRHELSLHLTALGHNESPAAFRCVLCYTDGMRTVFGEGSCLGTVSTIEVGEGGFGYDRMFTPAGNDRTFAEMTSTEKALLSHRAAAVQDIAARLNTLYAHAEPPTLPSSNPDAVDAGTVQSLALACCLAASTRYDELEELLRKNAVSHAMANMYYEALLQTYLFAGYPVALEALLVLHRVVAELLHEHDWNSEPFQAHRMQERGEALFARVYGGVAERVISKLGEASPDLAEWMVLEGYGKVLSRPGLAASVREVCVVAVLAVLGHQRQLVSHVRGAALVGASMEQILAGAQAVRAVAGQQPYESVIELMNAYLTTDDQP